MGVVLTDLPEPVRSVRDLVTFFYGKPVPIVPRENDYTVGTSAVPIGAWPQTRVGLAIGNTGSATVVIGFSAGVTATTGLPIPSGQGLYFSWFSDGELLLFPMYAISATAGQTVHTVESVLMGV